MKKGKSEESELEDEAKLNVSFGADMDDEIDSQESEKEKVKKATKKGKKAKKKAAPSTKAGKKVKILSDVEMSYLQMDENPKQEESKS